MLSEIAKRYFNLFCHANINGLRECFSNDITLRDWELDASGIESVIEKYSNIFSSLSNISVNIINLYEVEYNVIAELIIFAKEIEPIRVVDVLSFNKEKKIISIRAYKG